MPKLYEYFGLVVLFYSNEHEPIHVHGRYQGNESRAELVFEDGKLTEVRLASVKGKPELDPRQLQIFKKFVEHFAQEIVQKWMDFFVYNKRIRSEIITKRIV